MVRLFGRMGSLRDIVSSLAIAIGPVCNAFVIVLVVSAICEQTEEIYNSTPLTFLYLFLYLHVHLL